MNEMYDEGTLSNTSLLTKKVFIRITEIKENLYVSFGQAVLTREIRRRVCCQGVIARIRKKNASLFLSECLKT